MFIAVLGINNIGKSTQVRRLTERIVAESLTARGIKYPIYDLAPTGPMLNGYLREGNPHNLTPREFQILQALNRQAFEPNLRQMLVANNVMVAEDYIGTGIAWGMRGGVEKDFLVEINSGLLREDITILLDGERFSTGREANHAHEAKDDFFDIRQIHLDLAKEFGWQVVSAKGNEDEVHERVWQVVLPKLNL